MVGRIKSALAGFLGKKPAAIPEKAPAKIGPSRYRVQRVLNEQTLEAYVGDDGVAAVIAWEKYIDSDPSDYPGELRFVDALHGVRGRITR